MLTANLHGRSCDWQNETSPRVNAGLCLAAAASLGCVLLVSHPSLSPDLMGPFSAVHGLLVTLIGAFAGYAALVGLLWPVTKIAAVAAILPFAQTADPQGAGAANAGRAAKAAHEVQVGFYGGYNNTRPSQVHFVQPNDTNLTFEDVQWIGESFKTEPYWGVRVSYWSPKLRRLGLMFDYTHAKATALKSQTLKQSGMRDGEPVPPEEPFDATFRKLEFTHGLNFVTLNALYRNRALHDRISPYFGIGIGLSVPHVDTNRSGAPDEERTYSHQITGFAFQGLAGIEWGLRRSGRASAFTEYKLTYTANRGELTGGGHVETDLWTHQIPVGFSYHHPLGGAR